MKKKTTCVPTLVLALSSLLTTLGCSEEPTAVAPPARALEAEGPIIELLAEPDPFLRIQRLAELLPLLGEQAVPQIRFALEDPGVDIAAAEIELLTRAWARYKPGAALGYATTAPPPGLQIAAILPAIEEWAMQDPQAALGGLKKLVGIYGPSGKALQVGLVRGWYDSGKPGLTDYMRSLGDGFATQRALATFLRRVIHREGAQAAMRWAEALPDRDEKFKLYAYRQLASELTQVDPAAGVAWCEAHCEGPFGDNVRKLVGIRWAAQDGPAAIEWLSTAPEGRVRDDAIRDSFRRWLQVDQPGAYAWAESIGREDAEPWFGPIAEFYSAKISWDQPEEAMRWVAIIEDEERREQSYIVLARRWWERDESAAEAWLAQSPLSDEAREEARKPPLRNKVQRRKKESAEESGEPAEAQEQSPEDA